MSRRANLNETAYSNMGFGGADAPTIYCQLKWTCDNRPLNNRDLRNYGLPEFVAYNVTNMSAAVVERLIDAKYIFVKEALENDIDEYFTLGIDASGVFCGCDIIKMDLEPVTDEATEIVDGELELDIPSMQTSDLFLTDVSEDGEDIW